MSYRPIVSDLVPEAEPPVGALPELEWVPVSRLMIDDTYQRPIEKRGAANIARIAKEFDWTCFSPLLVARADNGYLVLDGQHRAHAAAACRIDQVPALVVEADARQQARAFSRVNGDVTALTPLQIYRAALASGEGWARECDAAVRAAGCRLLSYNKSARLKKPGDVFAVAAVRAQLEAGRREALVAYLGGLLVSSSADEPVWYGGQGINIYVPVLAELCQRDPAVVRGFLNAHPPDSVRARVLHLQSQAEYSRVSFRELMGRSLRALLKAHLLERAA